MNCPTCGAKRDELAAALAAYNALRDVPRASERLGHSFSRILALRTEALEDILEAARRLVAE